MILAMVIMMVMIMMVMMMMMGVVLNNVLLQPKPFVKVFENYKTDYLLLSTTTCWCLQRGKCLCLVTRLWLKRN